jgi:hypothetical protein
MPVQELSNLQIELLKLYSNGVSEKRLSVVKPPNAHYIIIAAPLRFAGCLR